MAQRRMFSKTITNSSQFLMMPQSTQNLYFHLGMNADDDGFCEHFMIMRMTDSKPDDLKILQAKGYINIFDDKVLIILDWKENNYLRSDRYTPSKYLEIYREELKKLSSGIPAVDEMATQDRLGKVRLGKDTNSTEDPVEKQEVSKFEAKDKELTDKLLSKIKANYPFLREKTEKQLEKDYEEMNKLSRIDGRTYEQIEFIINFSQEDKFWKQNIRSVPKLRKHFDDLIVKAKAKYEDQKKIIQA